LASKKQNLNIPSKFSNKSACDELNKANRELLFRKSLNKKPIKIRIAFDYAVCTVFVYQEGSVVVYNPRDNSPKIN